MFDENIWGVVLAGGQSKRMGGPDKALLTLNGVSFVERTTNILMQQVRDVLINTNASAADFSFVGRTIRADSVPGWVGPLAGILTGLEWAKEKGGAWVASAAVDTPFLPPDFVCQLLKAAQFKKADAAIASSRGRIHPVCGLWSVSLLESLRESVAEKGTRRVQDWVESLNYVTVEWPVGGQDPFINVNTPTELSLVRGGQLP